MQRFTVKHGSQSYSQLQSISHHCEFHTVLAVLNWISSLLSGHRLKWITWKLMVQSKPRNTETAFVHYFEINRRESFRKAPVLHSVGLGRVRRGFPLLFCPRVISAFLHLTQTFWQVLVSDAIELSTLAGHGTEKQPGCSVHRKDASCARALHTAKFKYALQKLKGSM